MPALLRISLGSTALALSLLYGSASSAAPPAKPAQPQVIRDAADDWFDKGSAAYEAHKLKEAESAFLEAWKLKKTQDTAANLGTVELELHEPRKAAEHLSYAVRHGAPTDSDAARRAASDRFEQARKLVGAIQVRVNLPGASVYLNGELVGLTPVEGELFVDPGSATVEAKLAGYQDARVVVLADAGSAKEANLVLLGAEEKRRSIVPAVVMGGVGAVALIAGGVLIGLAQSKKSTAQTLAVQTNHACPVSAASQMGACKDLESAAASGDTFGNTGIGLLVTTGVAAAGVATYLLWPQSHAEPVSGRRLRVLPLAGPSGGGVTVVGAF